MVNSTYNIRVGKVWFIPMFIVLNVLINTSEGWSQVELNLQETTGEEVKIRGEVVDFFKTTGGKYFSITTSAPQKGAYFASQFDENLNFIKKNKLIIVYEGKLLALNKIVSFGERYFLFLTFNNKIKKKKYLFYVEFNPETLTCSNNIFKVAELSAKKYGYESIIFEVFVNQSNSHILIKGKIPIQQPKEKFLGRSKPKKAKAQPYTFWVLDSDLEIVNYAKKHKIRVKGMASEVTYVDFTVGEGGAIYVLGRIKNVVRHRARERRKSPNLGRFEVKAASCVLEKIVFNEEIERYQTVDSIYYSDMAIILDGNVINLMGLLAEDVGMDVASTGFSRIRLNMEDLSQIDVIYNNFTPEVLKVLNRISKVPSKRKQARIAKKTSRMKYEAKERLKVMKRASYLANKIVYCAMSANNQPIIAIEEQYIITRYVKDKYGTTTTVFYHYDDIAFASFGRDSVHQMAFSKNQTYTNFQPARTFNLTTLGDELVLMIRDSVYVTTSDFSSVTNHSTYDLFKYGSSIINRKRSYYRFGKELDGQGGLLATCIRVRGNKHLWQLIEIGE
jgi:hypothetical protein